MKKKIFRIIMLLILVIPFAITFSACGKDKDKDDDIEIPPTPAEAKVSEVELVLAEEHGYDYDEETNTITFVYGTNIELLKENFVFTANYDDETTKTVSDYVIDTTAISGTPDVGTYVVNFTYKEKSASVNVKITPKQIEKPTIKTATFDFREGSVSGVKTIHSPELNGFDENTMEYVAGSTVEETDAGSYYVEIVPKSNYVWVGDDEEVDVVHFNWKINKKSIFMSSPETLEFVWDGSEKEINFVDYNPQFYPFDKYFEVVNDANSTVRATDRGEYTVTVKLKEDKAKNYAIVDIEYSIRNDNGTGDFVLSANSSTITYYWNIV